MSGLFGSPAAATQETYAGMQVSTSIMGNVIPYIAGRTRITANLGWYGNFQQHGSNSSGKGGGGAPGSNTYSAAWIGILSLGPITNVFQVFHDRSLVTLAYENLSLALGATGQPVWSGYPSGTPAGQQIPYSNLAYVATPLYNFGSSPSMPNLTYETEAGGIVAGYSDAHSMFDADCSKIVTDYLTNSVYGAGFAGTINAALLTGTSNTFQAYCMALGILTSPYENNQRAATDFITELMQICNSDVVLSCGDLRVIPYADTAVSGTTADGTFWSYTPNLTPLFAFGEGDYCPRTDAHGVPLEEPVILKRKPTRDTYNVLSVEYLDRSNYYNPTPAWASDNSDIAKRGPKAGSTITLHQITNAITAKQAAQMILNWQLYERNSYTFRVRFDYWPLEPMDLVSVTDKGQQLVNQVCRITEVAEDSDGFLTFTVMEVPGTIRNTPQYNWNPSQGYAQNFEASPGSVSAPAIFAMPPIAAALSEGITLGIAVGPPTSAAFWGGCNVYASLDGGTTYEYVGQVAANGAGRYGTLTANLPLVADPDTTSTLSIALNNTTEQISTAVTHAEADAMQTLCLLGSGATTEVISFGTAALISAGNYNLTYLRRGLYQTSPQANSSGARFVRLDGSIFYLAVDPGMAGQTINLKFTSFNSVGRAVEALSGVTAYPYVIPANFGGSAVNNQTWDSSGTVAMLSPTSAYKLTTGAGAWDSSIYSTLGFANGCTVQGYPSQTNDALMVGLTANPLASNNFANLAYALFCSGGSVLQIYEAGSLVMTVTGGYTPSTLLQIVYDGKHVSYWVAGSMVRTVSTPSGNQTYYAQFCMESPGSGIYGMDFSSSSLASQPFTLVPMTLNVACSGTIAVPNAQFASSAYGSRCFKSKESYSAGATLSFSYNPGGIGIIGFATAPVTGDTTGVAVNIAEWNPNTLSSQEAAYFNGTTIYTSGVAPVIGNVYTIEYDLWNFYWYKNNVLVAQTAFPNAGPLYLFGDFYQTVGAFINISFLNNGQLTPNPFVAGNVDSVTHDSTCEKISGGAAWNSSVYSLNAYGTCHLQGKTSDATQFWMMGLTTNPLASNSYINLNYAWYCDGGTWQIYESGTLIGSYGTAVATDLVAITYDSTHVNYYLNGILQRGPITNAGQTWYAQFCLNSVGAGLNSISFGPGVILDTVPYASIDPNAVSTIGSASSAAAVTNVGIHSTLVNKDMISLAVTTIGAPVAVDVSCTAFVGFTTSATFSTCNLQVYRDGAAVSGATIWDPTNSGAISVTNSTIPGGLQVTLSVTDTPAAGSHTYTLHSQTVLVFPSSGSGQLQTTNNFIKVREIKR